MQTRVDTPTPVVEAQEKVIAALAPVIAGHTPLPTLVDYFVRLWGIKLTITLFLLVQRKLYPPAASIQPTLAKRYPSRPNLEHRIFYPPSYEGGASKLLPLYLDIHGGGFAFGDPQVDDAFCTSWAARTGMLVVSLDYRKAPLHRYPDPVDDIAASAVAVLADAGLPIDHSCVILGGFSAGGTLAFSACQRPELQGRIHALVPYYPVVDWSTHPSEKFQRRLCTDRPTDSLEQIGPAMSWGYIPSTQDRCDGRLSPAFADKDHLPPWIMLIAAQHDILTRESRDLMVRLAGLGGAHELPIDEQDGFERGSYKYLLAAETSHGFTHPTSGNERSRKRAEAKSDEVYTAVHRWLLRGPLGTPKGKL